MPWIPTGPGTSFRPLRFEANSWSELMRLDPGTSVALHRHTGEVHAYNLSGARLLEASGEVVGPGDYHHEPGGTVDAWAAVGDQPCIVHLAITGTIDYLDTNGKVTSTISSTTQAAIYRRWCAENHLEPDNHGISMP